MPLPKLDLAPEQSQYAALMGPAVARASVRGGHARRRLDQLGAPLQVTLMWAVTQGEFAYLGAFFRQLIANGSQPFLIDLVVEQPWPTEQTAQLIPGSFQLTGVAGELYSCSATVEVVTPARDAVADAALVAARAAPVGGLPLMALTPSVTNYVVQRGETLLRSQPGFGPSWFRLTEFNTPSAVTVEWHVGDIADVAYLLAFYFTAIREGALPFVIETVHDHPDPRQLQATLVPGSFGLASMIGKTYVFRASVEVVPITSPDYDQQVFDLRDYTGGNDWMGLLEELATLVRDHLRFWP